MWPVLGASCGEGTAGGLRLGTGSTGGPCGRIGLPTPSPASSRPRGLIARILYFAAGAEPLTLLIRHNRACSKKHITMPSLREMRVTSRAFALRPPLGGPRHGAVASATQDSRVERLKILKPPALPGDTYSTRLSAHSVEGGT
jgi:hypothetical protein